jgi:ABC-2 type transport system permease protein
MDGFTGETGLNAGFYVFRNHLYLRRSGLLMFPQALQRIGHWLPLQAIVYIPAKTAVAFNPEKLAAMLATQLLWIAVIGLVVIGVYRKGVKKLNVNGG